MKSKSRSVKVKISLELEKESVEFIDTSDIKYIKIKKRFLSKILVLTIQYKEKVFTFEVPSTLKYMPSQKQDVERFMKLFEI